MPDSGELDETPASPERVRVAAIGSGAADMSAGTELPRENRIVDLLSS
jgi:hypothetical protein